MTVRVKGCGLPGLTATLVQRTEMVAWFLRSDGYHEVFLVKTGKTFDGSDTMEYYPGNENIGRTGICTSSTETAAKYYANLCLGKPLHEKSAPDGYKDITQREKCKIGRSQKEIIGSQDELL